MYIDVPADNCRVADRHRSRPRVARAIIDEIGRYPAAQVGDALDRFGLMDSAMQRRTPGGLCAGPALTILTREGDNLAIHRALDEAQPGDVLVVNGGGDTRRALFGELLAEVCLARGVAGVVIDGAIRDVEAIASLGLPVWARAVTPAGPLKSGPGVIGAPIACAGVAVCPADVIVGDGDGIAVVPAERCDETLRALIRVDAAEREFRDRLTAGRC